MVRHLLGLLITLLLPSVGLGNDYYTHGSYPATGSAATSAGLRAELDLITAGFDKMPALTGNASRAVIVNGSGTALSLTTGTLTLPGNFALSGVNNVTLTTTGATNVTLPTTGTLATLAGSEALTGKTFNLSSNTLTGTTAQFNTALSDNDFATLAGSESLSNKTVNLGSNTLSGTIAQFNTACSDCDFVPASGGSLTNATLTSPTLAGTPVFPDNVFTVGGSSDASKKVRFEVDGITTATTRAVTIQDSDGTLAYKETADTWSTGDIKLTTKVVADAGWVLLNDGTIGSAASGATTRANADTENLYTLLWTNCANAQCAVSTGRGASAAADFAANKTLALPKALGRALATYGAGSGLTSRVMGQTVGEETHDLSITEMPSHQHGISSGTGLVGGGGNFVVGTGSSVLSTATGGGAAHNVMQPTLFINVMIKL